MDALLLLLLLLMLGISKLISNHWVDYGLARIIDTGGLPPPPDPAGPMIGIPGGLQPPPGPPQDGLRIRD